MIRTMTTAVNTLGQLQQQIDIIGNNLANSSTHGYQSNGATFQELLYQQHHNQVGDEAPRQSPLGVRYGVGAMIGQTQMNWKQGSLQETNRELDFAFTKPKQYFNVLIPGADGEEIAYTRQGNFYVSPLTDETMMLVNGDGYPVADQAGNAITFPSNVKHYQIRPGGTLEVALTDGSVESFQLGVTVLERPNLMTRFSNTLFTLPANFDTLGVTQADVLTDLVGGDRVMIGLQNQKLESSNVQLEKEMTDLISVQRSYQFNARTVTLADQMLGLINSIR